METIHGNDDDNDFVINSLDTISIFFMITQEKKLI